jgi:hypothetical protein
MTRPRLKGRWCVCYLMPDTLGLDHPDHLTEVPDTLVSLGQARKTGNDRYVA